MLDIGIGISFEENYVSAAEEATKQARIALENKSQIDLGLIFNSCDFSATGITKTCSFLLNNVPLIGVSGPAIISPKGIFKHGIVLVLLSFPEGVHTNTAATKDISSKKAFDCGKELAEKLLFGFKNIPRDLGLFFFDRLINDELNFFAGLQENLGKSFPSIGTSLASQYNSTRSYLYNNNEVLDDSCTGIIWGGKIAYGMGIKHGWKPLGKPHIVSNSIGNIINSIDDKPAVRLYADYLAYDFEKLKKNIKKLSVFYPIGVFIPSEEEYILRNVITIEDRGALVCQGNIPEGSMIRLMISTQKTCLDAATQAINEAKDNLEASFFRQRNAKNSRIAIIFSSISRYNLLRRDIKKELDSIKKGLGEIPFLGIYTNGELAPLKTSNYRSQIYFHNQDFTVLIIEG